MTVSTRTSSGGFDIELELDRATLLPGRLVDGEVRVTSHGGGEIRGARVTLVGTERWRYDKVTSDAQGHARTEIATDEEDLPAVPVAVLGATGFGRGETRTVGFQLPVPDLGPATFEATELAVDWQVRVNLDVPGFDPSLAMAVRILQPTALLRAGVVDLAEFALYPEAAAEADGFGGSVWLDPSPLCIGAPFKGRITLEAAPARRVQEVRLELRVKAESTVSGGRDETLTLWTGVVAGPGEFGGAQTIEFASDLPEIWLPTIATKHGRADAQFHVIIATAFARDPHLIRDVTICSTREL
jgi:hypothetical protein